VKESDYITMANAEHSQRTSYATGKLLTEFFMRDAVETGKKLLAQKAGSEPGGEKNV
jgi:dTDP-glucose 4,6-dehydratase